MMYAMRTVGVRLPYTDAQSGTPTVLVRPKKGHSLYAMRTPLILPCIRDCSVAMKYPAKYLHREFRRTAFNYWLAGQEQPNVAIFESSSVAEAEQTLKERFDGRVVKVERLSAAGGGWLND